MDTNNFKLSSRDHGLSQDTADTLTSVNSLDSIDVNVTTVTPRSTPRVLDDESFEDTNLSVTNSQDSVIEISTATSREDTLAVELEDILISFDQDGNGEVDDGSLKLFSGLGSDELVARVDLMGLGSRKLASTVLGSVGIVRFEFKTVLAGILNSEIRPASLASVTGIVGTINDLLFREGEEFTGVNEVETFDGTSGGESPA
jgi:hypothetical protein